MSPNSRALGVLLLALLAWPLGASARTCQGFPPASSSLQVRDQANEPGTASHGLDLANLDPSVSPCKDFYAFADGGWIKAHQIPADDSSWGLIDELQQHNLATLHQILEQEAASRAQARLGSIGQKLGDFYAACMNTSVIDATGWKPLAPEFRRIARARNRAALETEIGRLQQMGARPLFQLRAGRDLENNGFQIIEVAPDGLGLPDPDDYLQQDISSQKLRQEYLAHVAQMFALVGDRQRRARSEAKAVLKIETRLAAASMPPIGRSDPAATDHIIDVQQLQALTPHFPWTRFFRPLDLPSIHWVKVSQPRFFRAMDRDLTSIPLADWKIYLRWHLIHTAAPDLSAPFVDDNFDFYGRVLAGARAIEPRWQRCVHSTDRQLGELLGREFVARAFPPTAKAAAFDLVRHLIATFREDLQTLDWMSPSTRAAALAKLDRMTIQVGFPDRWPEDSGFPVATGPYVENVFRGNRFHSHLDLAEIGRPVDRSRWSVRPSTADAFYDPSTNEIVLPAGILQPPLFDSQADDALNYGGIGAIIGHEMTHGFDNEGSRFDAEGNLRNWWTPQDIQNFRRRAACIANQFDTYVAADDLHENGHQVLGESVADLGGLTIAYKAFEKTAEFHSRKKIQGFTPRQRFFLAYARIWTMHERPQFIRRMVRLNPHALGRFRTIGPLSDLEMFSRAFGCHDRDPMVRPAPDRCKIW